MSGEGISRERTPVRLRLSRARSRVSASPVKSDPGLPISVMPPCPCLWPGTPETSLVSTTGEAGDDEE